MPFPAVCSRELCAVVHGGVLHDGIEPIEAVDPLRERRNRCVAREIQRPDCDARTRTVCRLGDCVRGGVAALRAPHGDDHGGAQADEVLRRFQAETSVSSRDDDGLAFEVGVWVREDGGELRAQHHQCERHVRPSKTKNLTTRYDYFTRKSFAAW